MRKSLCIGILMSMVLVLLVTVQFATASSDGHTIHPFQYGTTISRTSPPGEQLGCLTACTDYTLYVDFYYVDTADVDQQITSLTFETGGGTPVAFPVTWGYTIDGGTNWFPYSGTGNIDVPWSGKNAPGQLDGTEPHATVRVTFHVSGSLGEEFYYRIHFTSIYYNDGPGNAGNHYFWYDICGVPEVPELSLATPLATSLGTILLIATQKVFKRKRE